MEAEGTEEAEMAEEAEEECEVCYSDCISVCTYLCVCICVCQCVCICVCASLYECICVCSSIRGSHPDSHILYRYRRRAGRFSGSRGPAAVTMIVTRIGRTSSAPRPLSCVRY